MCTKNRTGKKIDRHIVSDLKNDLLTLESDLSNVPLLLSLQFKIIKYIVRQERYIKLLKRELAELKIKKRKGGIDKEQSKSIKGEIKEVNDCIDSARFRIFILKMFGDGIAFLYIDKFEVKQLFYNVADYKPKEQAGNLGGKDGLKEEWRFIKEAAKRNIPALLNDITMSVRHGDVCILGNDRPVIIEVKSSKNKNNRVERQLLNLQRLDSFLSEDVAEDFRALPLVRRMELCIPEVTYIKELNITLDACREHGGGWTEVEEGFYIVAVREMDVVSILSKLDIKGREVWPVFLNEYKNNQLWLPLTPFTNSIHESTDLCDFINGDLTIICVLNLEQFKKIALEEGFELVFNFEGEYTMMFKEVGSELIWGSSWQMMLRVPLELTSMSWLIRDGITRYKALQQSEDELFSQVNGSMPPSPFNEFRHLFLK